VEKHIISRASLRLTDQMEGTMEHMLALSGIYIYT